MTINNAVYDCRGNIEGFECHTCGQIVQRMWGTKCNHCRAVETHRQDMLKAIALHPTGRDADGKEK